jgi:hypothetical protein
MKDKNQTSIITQSGYCLLCFIQYIIQELEFSITTYLPTYSQHLAKLIGEMLEKNIFDDKDTNHVLGIIIRFFSAQSYEKVETQTNPYDVAVTIMHHFNYRKYYQFCSKLLQVFTVFILFIIIIIIIVCRFLF